MIARIWIRYHFLILASLLFLLLRLPSLFEPYWYGDEGIYLVLGQGIRRGLTLYRDLHDNKPPGLYYLAALSQTVFGFRLLLTLWMIPTIYTFWLLVRQFLNIRFSRLTLILFIIFSSIPFIEGSIANAEIFMLLPTILAVYLIYTQPSPKNLFLAGLLLGFAFTIKIPVAAEFAFLSFWLVFFSSRFTLKRLSSYFRYLIILGFGFALPIILWGLFFALKGVLSEYLFAALFQNFGYLSSWSSGSHSGSATQGGLISRLFILLLFWLIVYFLKIKRRINTSAAFVLLWFSATIFGALLSTRPYPHYLIQVLPPFLLSLLLPFQRQMLHSRFIFALILGSFFLFLVKYKFYYYPIFRYYTNFYSYSLGLKSTRDYQSYFGSNVASNYSVASYVKTNTQTDDRIFVWGDEPYIYALSDRLPSGKYTVSYHVADFQGYSHVLDSFKIHTPKLIIVYPSSRPFPQLHQFIDKYYSLSHQINSILIFKLR